MKSLFGKIFSWFLGTSLLPVAAFPGDLILFLPSRQTPPLLPIYLWTLPGDGGPRLLGGDQPGQAVAQPATHGGGLRSGIRRPAPAHAQDEIGGLSRAFDRMAERIETLLTAERRLLQDVPHEPRSPLARLRFAWSWARTDGDREEALTLWPRTSSGWRAWSTSFFS